VPASGITARAYDVEAVRARFPSLGRGTVFFDGAAGTQVPAACVRAVADYLETANSNSTRGAPFTSTPAAARTNEIITRAHEAMAAFLGAGDQAECVFGPNMTTLSFAMSRRIGQTLREGDELLLSPLDHDANIAPWLVVAEERGLRVRWLEPSYAECGLDPSRVAAAIGPRTRVVSVAHASNAVGTLVDIPALAEIAAAAHRNGAILWVDAVHAAPHIGLDVVAAGADVLLCSAYKFYGPHLGVCWARTEVLASLPWHNVRWRSDELPHRLETGALAFELLAGLLATFDHLAWIGRTFAIPAPAGGLRAELVSAQTAIRAYESALAVRLLTRLAEMPGARVYGIAEPRRVSERCPTVAFTLDGVTPWSVADRCAREGLAVWSGEFASFELMRGLGLEPGAGVVRASIAQYTTAAEVDHLADVVGEVARSRSR